jgi:copper/silver efflux system protein
MCRNLQISGALHRKVSAMRCAFSTGLIPTLWASGIGFDVMKPMRAPMVGGMITSTIHVLILVPVFFVLMKERVSWRGTLQPKLVQ